MTDTLVLDEQSFFRPLGMQHFYDSFALVSQMRPLLKSQMHSQIRWRDFFLINAALVITTVAVMSCAKVVMGRQLDRKDWSAT